MLKFFYPIPRFFTSGETIAGKGSLSSLRTLNATRTLVLTSKSVAQHHSKKIDKSLGSLDHKIEILESGEPSLDVLKKHIDVASDYSPDWIVAIGGGSVLDAAKALWVFYEHPYTDKERLKRPFSCPPLRRKARLVAVPTTFGTGSEVSSTAVLSYENGQAKNFIVSHELLPDISLLDPELTMTTPTHVLVHSALDALSHSVEGYVSKTNNSFLDSQAEKAIEMILEFAKPGIIDKNIGARSELMNAAMMAGWVQNIKVPGIGHSIAHALGTYGIGHGQACGASLPVSVSFNQQDETTAARYQRLASITGKESLSHLIKELHEALDYSTNLSSLHGKAKEHPSYSQESFVEGVLSDICTKMNPLEMSQDQLLEMIKDNG